MKYHIAFKFIAILLCACCLLVSIGAGLGIVALVEADLYNTTVDQLQLEQEEYRLTRAADQIAKKYAMEALCDLPEEAAGIYLYENYGSYHDFGDIDQWYYTLEDEGGNTLSYRTDTAAISGAQVYEKQVYVTYPVVLDYRRIDPTTGEEWEPTVATVPGGIEVTVPQTTEDEWIWIPDTAEYAPEGSGYLHIQNWGYEDDTGFHQYRLGICESPRYRVTLYLTSGVYAPDTHWSWQLAEFGYANRYNIIWALGAALLLFAVFFVYLCCAAGRKPKSEEVCPGGLNRIPLDLYAVCAGTAVVLLAAGGYELLRWNMDYLWDNGLVGNQWLLVLAVCAMVFLACLLVVAFLFACAAQLKMRQFYWVKHSLTAMVLVFAFKVISKCFGWICKGGRWFFSKLPPVCEKLWNLAVKLFEILKKIVLTLWELVTKILKEVWSFLGRMLRTLWHGIQRFSQLLPLTWQWLLVGLGMTFVLLISLDTYSTGIKFLGISACICIVMYGAHCFGTLLESTKRMSKGDLDVKVEDKLLLGSFKEYATDLNALADVAVEAAKKQMKSERMKAELVTNVSHDIKTPLTSIINYVDLLQKAESQEQAEEYLEVLNRQSQRLKKLIEDLMEMSKASTGNMAVELTRVDAVETVNQALGEFSEKLEKAQLTPVFNPPQEPMMMVADGRLTWRVLSNLLGNAVKYALPGTRLYIDLVSVEGQVLISLKNISAEQLNVSSEELMERFVRGDASRNTEGSGLGLNIAKSLMELQKGQMQLLVDGDLFKVTLLFPES